MYIFQNREKFFKLFPEHEKHKYPTNSGKIALAFNNEFKLISEIKAEFGDCYRELTLDDLTKISDKITEYKIEDYSASKEYVYQVNTEKVTIIKKK
jgi:hypothetical protein